MAARPVTLLLPLSDALAVLPQTHPANRHCLTVKFLKVNWSFYQTNCNDRTGKKRIGVLLWKIPLSTDIHPPQLAPLLAQQVYRPQLNTRLFRVQVSQLNFTNRSVTGVLVETNVPLRSTILHWNNHDRWLAVVLWLTQLIHLVRHNHINLFGIANIMSTWRTSILFLPTARSTHPDLQPASQAILHVYQCVNLCAIYPQL